MKTNLSKYDNSWYDPGAGLVKRTLWFIVNVVFFQCPLNPFSSLKVFLLRLFGAKIGKSMYKAFCKYKISMAIICG